MQFKDDGQFVTTPDKVKIYFETDGDPGSAPILIVPGLGGLEETYNHVAERLKRVRSDQDAARMEEAEFGQAHDNAHVGPIRGRAAQRLGGSHESAHALGSITRGSISP